MPKKINKTPNNNLLELPLKVWKEHKAAISIFFFLLLALLAVILYCQCQANTKRTWAAVIWNDFKMIGLYVFGLLSPTIIALISKFHNYLNK